MVATLPAVSAVIIGRNEGDRLKRCLASVAQQVPHLVYVDSGSSDDSVAHARQLGIEVIELDMSVPFTAARGRNTGAFVASARAERPDYIQFIDGDCLLVPGWIEAAVAHLEARPDLAIVTGWRSEIRPEASVYNRMCDVEWHRPAGSIAACGGDMMVRTEAFLAVGGFDPAVIAAEDDEFCIRIRRSGLGIERLPRAMTRHDAAMTRFSEWWLRAKRAGHGFAQVGRMHPGYFRHARRRVWVFGLALPVLMLAGAGTALAGATAVGTAMVAAAVAGYLLSYLSGVRGLAREGLGMRDALHHGLFLSLSKVPNLLGMLTYFWRRLRQREMKLIEYK